MGWQEGYCGLAKEADYATSTAPTHYLPVRDFAAEEQTARIVVGPWGTSAPEPRLASLIVRGQIQFEPQPDPFGLVLTGLLGAPRTTTVASGIYQHVFEPRGDRPSYSVEGAIGGLAVRAIGAKFPSLTLAVPVGGRLQATTEIVARELRTVGTATASYAVEEAATWNNATVSLSGTSEPLAVGVGMSITAPLVPLEAYGSGRRIAALLPSGPTGPVVALTVFGQTSAWLSYAREETELSFRVLATGALVGASSYSLTIDCPRLRAGSALLTSQVRVHPVSVGQFAVFASPAAVRGVSITLVNITAGY